MKIQSALFVIIAVLGFLGPGCAGSPVNVRTGHYLGATSKLGGGTVASYATFDQSGAPKSLGVVFSAGTLEGLPSEPSDGHHCFDADQNGSIALASECSRWHEFVLPMPSEASRRPDINRIQQEVLPIVLFSGEVHLRDHHPEEPAVYLEMNMGRPGPAPWHRIASGLDGLERVHPVFVCDGFAKAEEVRVLRYRTWIRNVDVPAFRVRLPDLYHHSLEGPTLLVGDPTCHVDDFPIGHASRAGHRGQIIVVGHWPRPIIAIQIEWPLVLVGSLPALFRECPARDGEGSPEYKSNQQNGPA